MIRSNLGTNPWVVLEVALANLLTLTPGTLSVIVGLIVLVVSMIMGEKIGWGTLANILIIGPWEDFFLHLLPSVTSRPFLQTIFLITAIFSMGIATAIYIGVDAGAGPRDSLMLAVKRTTGLSLRLARTSIEIFVVLIGWILGGPLGLGTLVFALLIGPAVQLGFRIFRVKPHRTAAEV
ncbi:MAG TPA: hypothetical protein VJZ78_04940 [Anaerolineales bacterium]|nr:hypothetical protein [Anaerolineales bacterium]